jgi:hypothetical protein
VPIPATTTVPSATLARCLALLLSLLVPPSANAAELASHAPVVAVAYSPDGDGDLVSFAAGWQFRFAAGDTMTRLGEATGTDLSIALEPMVAYLRGDGDTGHTDTIEAQVVPLLRATPRALADGRWVPYFEAGIGLAYTDLRGFDLGSRFQFSDNAGLGISFPVGTGGGRWSVGYRFRHISHAGLWADANAGLNSHFLLLTFQ